MNKATYDGVRAGPAYIGIDVGTGSVKALALDSSGRLLHATVSEHPTVRPAPGWAEQLPDDWWSATCAAARELVAHPAVAGWPIAGIGLSGQMHGATLLDADGKVLRPSPVWSDGRGARQLELLAARLAPHDALAITGSLPNSSATLAKLLWLREHERPLYARIRYVLLAKDEVRRRLTGVYATDPTDAAGTALYDLHRGTWSSTVLSAAELDPSLLAPIVPSSARAGSLTAAAATATGLPAGTPVVAGAGDAAAAVLGALPRALADGESSGGLLVSIGTAAQVLALTSRPIIDPLGRVQTLPAASAGRWQLMGATLAGGAALEWLARVLAAPRASGDATSRQVARLLAAAQQVAPGADRLLFLPYLAGERSPHLDPLARGVFVGLSPSHTRAHLARAVVEGVALALRDCLDVLRTLEVMPQRVYFTGRPAANPLWRRVLADVLALPVVAIQGASGSAAGAALLARAGVAGVAVDAQDTTPAPAWPAPPGVSAGAASSPTTLPDPRAVVLYEACFATYRPLYAALAPTFRALAAWPEA